MDRFEEVKDFILKLKELEKQYKVKIIADDDYVGLLYQDEIDKSLYEFENGNVTKI
ncbi:hypothetical protein [Bacillus pumilus]|uniref:hypothetical protein n=1 Tax=Bacillus pumilus TaxID=1408 RepID=UPI00164259F3|nr:hypothetical protein [Bacillus pumilus]